MENNNISQAPTGIGLGIAGLVLGIIALPLALLGCTSVVALLLAIVGVALSTVGLSQARKTNAQTSLIMAGMVVSIIALSFAGLKFTNSLFNNPFRKIHQIPWEVVNNKIDVIDDEADEFGRAFEEEFEREIGGDLEDVLRDLEHELDELEDELHEMTDELEAAADELNDNEEAARRLGRAAGKAVREFVDEINDSTDIKIEIDVD